MDYDDLPVPEGTHVASMYFGSPNWTKGKNLDDLRYDALIRKLNSTESSLNRNQKKKKSKIWIPKKLKKNKFEIHLDVSSKFIDSIFYK